MDVEGQKRRGSLFGPAILVVLGIVFLLNNLGVTSFGVWDLVRLWPIFLIAAGLDLLIGRRSAWGSVLALFLILALLAGGLWLPTVWAPRSSTAGEEIQRSVGDATRAEIEIGFGAGRLFVYGLSESRDLIRGTAQLQPGERIEQAYKVADHTARFSMQSKGEQFGPVLGGWDADKAWNLGLNRDVPMQLSVAVGAGTASLDLGQLNLTGLDVNPGVGKTIVILPRVGQLEVSIESGIGQVIVEVPEGMAVRAWISHGIGAEDIPSDYSRQGDAYVSPGYADAENRVELKASVGIGQVAIREYRGE
jgi:hypothetical protein